MPAAGDTHTPRLAVPDGTADTRATLVVYDPDERVSTPAVTATPDGTEHVGAPVTLTQPGEWRLVWTVRDPDRRPVQTLLVAPGDDDDAQVPGFSFATTADLARYTGRAPEPGSRRLLVAASAEIERITRAAVYLLADDGRPADPLLRRAMADATCELLGWWAETGTGTGGRALYTSASIAGVSLGRGGANTANPQADRVGPKVWTILLGAGLIVPGAVGVRG